MRRPPLYFLIVGSAFVLALPLLILADADRFTVATWLVPFAVLVTACSVGLRQRWRFYGRILWWAAIAVAAFTALYTVVTFHSVEAYGAWWYAIWWLLAAPFWAALFLALSGASSFVRWWRECFPNMADSRPVRRRGYLVPSTPRPGIRAIQIAASIMLVGALMWMATNFGLSWPLLGLNLLLAFLVAMSVVGMLRWRSLRQRAWRRLVEFS